jgi:hypothetical protein
MFGLHEPQKQAIILFDWQPQCSGQPRDEFVVRVAVRNRFDQV